MKDISKDIAGMEATLLALKQLLEDLVKGARTAKEAASLTDAFELSLEAIDELLPDWDEIERKGSPEEQDNLEYADFLLDKCYSLVDTLDIFVDFEEAKALEQKIKGPNEKQILEALQMMPRRPGKGGAS